jgi:hypothetical protein
MGKREMCAKFLPENRKGKEDFRDQGGVMAD